MQHTPEASAEDAEKQVLLSVQDDGSDHHGRGVGSEIFDRPSPDTASSSTASQKRVMMMMRRRRQGRGVGRGGGKGREALTGWTLAAPLTANHRPCRATGPGCEALLLSAQAIFPPLPAPSELS
eukprot:2816708-Rhodomonas_salina.1